MNKNEEVVLGTGCFWCTEAIFKTVAGVVKITYDSDILDFEKLMKAFVMSHDPTSLNRQGNDVGIQYRSIILYTTETQKEKASEYLKKVAGAVTEIKPLGKFYPAENYHTDYFAKNGSVPYCQYVVNPKIEHFKKVFKI